MGKAKGKNKNQQQSGNFASDGLFHYFGLELIKNADGTVLVKWSQLNPLPDGWILKDFSLNKHDASWDQQSNMGWIGSPYGLGPSQSEDIRNWPQWAWEFLDPYSNPPGSPGLKYNITGSAGIPNDVSSGNPIGSEVLTVTF